MASGSSAAPDRSLRMPIIVAFDIETCPLPEASLGPRARRRRAMLVEREARLARAAGGAPTDEAALQRRVQSVHGALGWICCASFVRLGPDGEPCTPHSLSAASPDQEAALLDALWSTLARLPRAVRWISFYGKSFDAEFLATRSIAHGLVPSRPDLLHRHPYVHHPHLDLASVWRRTDMGLADVCELLGIPSPKAEAGNTVCDGSGVAEAVAAGRVAEVVAYCERDAVATLQAYRALAPYL